MTNKKWIHQWVLKRICKHCNNPKEENSENFAKNWKYFHSICKVCRSIIRKNKIIMWERNFEKYKKTSKIYFNKNKEARTEYNTKWYHNNKKLVKDMNYLELYRKRIYRRILGETRLFKKKALKVLWNYKKDLHLIKNDYNKD